MRDVGIAAVSFPARRLVSVALMVPALPALAVALGLGAGRATGAEPAAPKVTAPVAAATTQPVAVADASGRVPVKADKLEPEAPSRDPGKRAKQMARWFADLASADAGVREAARVSLMGMGRDDLPALRKLVVDHKPLLPSQAVVLKEVVTQMYLADDVYDTAGHDGFLGIRPAEVNVGVRQPDAPEGQGAGGDAQGQAQQPVQQPVQLAPVFPGAGGWEVADPNAVYGIVVMERMPGFTGARSLQDGDVILGIVERPNIRLTNAPEFSVAIRSLGAGTKAHFEILRQGQVIRVEVKLDPRPDAADFVGADSAMKRLLDDRKKAVDELWDREFAPLLEEGVG